MRGRLSSLTGRIHNAVATLCEFCPEIREKQNQSATVAIFSQLNSNEDQKNKVFSPVCAIGICLIEMKTTTERFYLTTLLFVVLLCDICIF